MDSYSSDREAVASIKDLVEKVKKKMFCAQVHEYSPSAYDTAWLAMIPDSNNGKNPRFKCCLNWVLNNQQQGGFWGNDHHQLIHTLSSTLACMLALATWNVGPKNIELGMLYVGANAKKLLHVKLPRWFTIIIIPAMVEHAESVGLHLNFPDEFKALLYSLNLNRSYDMNSATDQDDIHFAPVNIYKDALAFRLLRSHGFSVTPGIFCWFLDHEKIMDHLEEYNEYFASILYNIYRASDLMFPEEYELEDTKSFSRRLLEKTVSLEHEEHTDYLSKSFKRMIEKELSNPWIARLDHLDHRMWIEDNSAPPLCMGKPSFSRLSCLDDHILLKLSVQNYELRQSIFRSELEELKSWCSQWSLADMGFGREKTTYCHFAICGTLSSPQYSIIRKLVTKSAILITVADDFYDMEGSLTELQALTEAVQRWDGEGLIGPSKTIFDALDDFVRGVREQFPDQERHDMMKKIQALWKESFASWMTETLWGRTGYTPSADEYLEVGMTSIAAHTVVLPSSCFLTQRMPAHKISHPHYESITKLLMVSARLLNDIQSYQKEQEEGINNLVLVYQKDHPNADIKDSIEYVKNILNVNRMRFIQHVFGDDHSEMPKPCKYIHLQCFKVYGMFYNSSNQFDSKTALLEDIENAIYIAPRNPLSKSTTKHDDHFPLMDFHKKKGFSPPVLKINLPSIGVTKKFQIINWYGCRNKNLNGQRISLAISSGGCRKVTVAFF